MEQKPFGSSWLLEWYTQWPMPGSTWRGVLALESYFIVSVDKNSFVCPQWILGLFPFLKILCGILS